MATDYDAPRKSEDESESIEALKERAEGFKTGIPSDPSTDLGPMVSSQQRVTGEVRVNLRQGHVQVTGVRSKWSMHAVQQTAYGEHTALWTGADAKGFSLIHGTSQWLAAQAARAAGGDA